MVPFFKVDIKGYSYSFWVVVVHRVPRYIILAEKLFATAWIIVTNY